MVVTVKESSPIAGRHFAKRREHGGKRFRWSWDVCSSDLLLHFSQEIFIRLTHFCCRVISVIGEDMRRPMDPGISSLDIGPQGSGLGESFDQKSAHAF